ncbi:RDD family protein [Microvirga tunisiensis]|uniref:RDD family protein n=1 Tax=Pannonibacter tanglangensis TaxID=2750084 RepID=A0A7X5J8S8_9HYPH|nr:RDD family protein [Pannonibacter sp. XCT-53]NBN78192.1 RDD family protein [Pannonibacter sp. XCT-53]
MSYDATYAEPKRDAFDPMANPALFDGIRGKRVFAFLIDVLFVAFFSFLAAVLVFFLGVFTLGLGVFLYAFLWQGVALVYTAVTLGGPRAATPGMRMMGLEMRLWYGARPYALLAAMHVLLFWVSVTLLTPLVVLVSLFSDRKRLLHDIVLGTVVVNAHALPRA